MAEAAFDFKKFIDETRATLLSPSDYFSVMPKKGGYGEPLIKALIYGTVGAFINLIWSILDMGVIDRIFGSIIGGGIGLVGFLISVLLAIALLFIGGAIILVISAICEGDTEYESNLRVTSSLMVLSPINAICNIFYKFNNPIGSLINIAIILYGFWMFYNAITMGLGGKKITAKIMSIILSLIPISIVLSGLICSHIYSNFISNDINAIPNQLLKEIPSEELEMKKALEEATKGLEMMNRELQEEMSRKEQK